MQLCQVSASQVTYICMIVIELFLYRDLMGVAGTDSGKTLAFLIPAIEMMYKCPKNGMHIQYGSK